MISVVFSARSVKRAYIPHRIIRTTQGWFMYLRVHSTRCQFGLDVLTPWNHKYINQYWEVLIIRCGIQALFTRSTPNKSSLDKKWKEKLIPPFVHSWQESIRTPKEYRGWPHISPSTRYSVLLLTTFFSHGLFLVSISHIISTKPLWEFYRAIICSHLQLVA